MPRFQSLAFPGWLTTDSWIINLDAGVGRNRPNQRDDTKVVQFYLEALRSSEWEGTRIVRRDGRCGTVTIESILAFQRHVNATYRASLLEDGAVDPLWEGGEPITKTLGWMSHLYVSHFRQFWPNIRRHNAYQGVGSNLNLFLW